VRACIGQLDGVTQFVFEAELSRNALGNFLLEDAVKADLVDLLVRRAERKEAPGTVIAQAEGVRPSFFLTGINLVST
jgi:hypothetical protein